MPFIKKITTQAGILGIWRLQEPVENLLRKFHFSVEEKEEFRKIKAEKRKAEYLAVRLLLEKLTGVKPTILYSESGKPSLKNETQQLSISHSAELVVVLLSNWNVGVDVENIYRDVRKIETRFLHNNELEFISKTNSQQVTKILYWSAKEAIFKCSHEQGILFNEQISILPFQLEKEGRFEGLLILDGKKTEFQLEYFFYENNVVVCCVEKEINTLRGRMENKKCC
ncbi:MAG: 4'-phosphopantetheinyl transferase superfamily protein [Prolixibacteraceae bacterium]|nr:4'-phosphopantetheinyl transferase superfamily protein [Prolixibacteraceae bacterium]